MSTSQQGEDPDTQDPAPFLHPLVSGPSSQRASPSSSTQVLSRGAVSVRWFPGWFVPYAFGRFCLVASGGFEGFALSLLVVPGGTVFSLIPGLSLDSSCGGDFVVNAVPSFLGLCRVC